MMQPRNYVIRGLVKVEDVPAICKYVSLDFVEFHLRLTKKDKKEGKQISKGTLKAHSSRYLKYREFEMSGTDLEHMRTLHEQVKPYMSRDYTRF